ncbi:MAG: MBL fold metallo-hydrolase [Desulfobacterium sp.]|nr:MBL fold metallo-hydrolase [Desulfobacterium sp.]
MEKQDFIEQLADNFYLVKGPDNARIPFCNSFLLQGRERVLIDAGAGEAIIKAIDRERRIDVLIITHSHPDHILASHVLKDRHLMLPQESPESVHDLFELGKRFTGSDQGGSHWKKRMEERYGLHPLKPADSRYSHGDRINLGGASLEAIHLPGHLRDHYGFFDHNSKTLLTTDVDFTGFGPWYGNGEATIDQFKQDVKTLAPIEANRVCSSHKRPLEGQAKEAFDRFLAAFDRQQQEVLACVGTGATLETMVAGSPFYHHRFPDSFLQKIYEGHLVKKNLDLLVRAKVLRLENGIYTKDEEKIHAIH